MKFCDFRLTEGNCLCDSSGWTRLDDIITYDIFLSFVHSLIRTPNNGKECFGTIFLEPKTIIQAPHLLSFKRLYAPVKKRHIC